MDRCGGLYSESRQTIGLVYVEGKKNSAKSLPEVAIEDGSQKYRRIKKIGHGAFGEAFTVESLENKKLYVMKIEKLETQMRRKRMDEVKALKKCDHPNIVQYIDHFLDCKNSNIVMEYCSGGDLAAFIKKEGSVPQDKSHQWIKDLARGMQYVQRQKIVHRDLKPENIFICSLQSLKIGDFGLARCFDRSSEMASSKCGTPAYMAPETLEDHPIYNHKADMWSIGCIFYEILFSKRPFVGGRRSLINNICQGRYQPIPACLSILKYVDIISNLLRIDPISRLNASEVVEILEAPDNMRPLPETPVPEVIQEIKPTNSQPVLPTVEVESQGCNIQQGQPFQSFGAAWDHGALENDNSTEQQNSRPMSSDLEKGWQIGQSGQLDRALTGNNSQEQRNSDPHSYKRAHEDDQSPSKKSRTESDPEIICNKSLQDLEEAEGPLDSAIRKVVSYQMTPKQALSHYNLTPKVLFESLLGTDEDRKSILTKVDLSDEMEEVVITFCRNNKERLSYRAVINLVRELKGGASEE